MIICKTPLRISFFGGGTDLPSFFEKEFGCVISTSIDKYIHVVGHNAFDNNYKIHYNKIEIVNDVENITNTRVKASLKKIQQDNGVEIYSIAEVPHGTGLGSSSSFTVGLLNLLNNLNGNEISKEELAKNACEIEIDELMEPIGKQDQHAAAYGGFNYIQFNVDGSVETTPLKLKKELQEEIERRIVVFYLNKTRNASDILKEQNKNIISQEEKFAAMQRIKEIALAMRKDLDNDNIENFGKMLHESWILKKNLTNSISNPSIDEIYDDGISAGATGGKVLGAGGGGFILFYCEPEYQENLRKSLLRLKEFKIKFENEGSQKVYEC